MDRKKFLAERQGIRNQLSVVADFRLKFSRSCIGFLEEYCVNREADGRLYFTVYLAA